MESNLRWPVQWMRDGRALIYKPRANATDLQMDEVTNLVLVPRDKGILYMLDHWDDYWHFGDTPNELEKEQFEHRDANEARQLVDKLFKVGAEQHPAATAATKDVVVCAAATVDCPVRIWILDSGCGFDLACAKDLSGLEDYFIRSPDPNWLHTANGSTLADTEYHSQSQNLVRQK